jgi:hypothetical protein
VHSVKPKCITQWKIWIWWSSLGNFQLSTYTTLSTKFSNNFFFKSWKIREHCLLSNFPYSLSWKCQAWYTEEILLVVFGISTSASLIWVCESCKIFAVGWFSICKIQGPSQQGRTCYAHFSIWILLICIHNFWHFASCDDRELTGTYICIRNSIMKI